MSWSVEFNSLLHLSPKGRKLLISNSPITCPPSSRKLDEEKRKRLQTLINVLIVAFSAVVLVIGGSNLVYITFHLNQISSAMQIPVGYVYLVLPISGLFIIYYAINDIGLVWKHPSETDPFAADGGVEQITHDVSTEETKQSNEK